MIEVEGNSLDLSAVWRRVDITSVRPVTRQAGGVTRQAGVDIMAPG